MFIQSITKCAYGALPLAVVTTLFVLPVEADDSEVPEYRSEDLRLEQTTTSQNSTDIHFISDLESPVSASELIAQATDTATESEAPTDRRGFYLSASGMWQGRQRASEVDAANTFLDFSSGFSASAAVGYRFANNLRLEGEFTYFNNSIEFASAQTPMTPVSGAAQGNVGLYSFMANAYYDIPTNSRFRPYVGVGLGFYISRINELTATFFPFVPLNPVNQTSETSFAFQFKAGVSYEISPKSEAFLGYRYFYGDVLKFNDPGNLERFSPNGARIHAAEIGLRYFF